MGGPKPNQGMATGRPKLQERKESNNDLPGDTPRAGFTVEVRGSEDNVLGSQDHICINVENSGGSLIGGYKPERAICRFIQFFGDWLALKHLEIEGSAADNITQEGLEVIYAADCIEPLEKCVSHAVNILCNQVQEKLEEALDELVLEVITQTLRDLNEQFKVIEVPALKFFEAVQKESVKKKNRRMNLPQSGGARNAKHSWSDADRSSLAEQHERLKLVWKDAKKIYKQNRNRAGWAKMVKAAYSDLPDELIMKLSSMNPYESSPANIALEHAAILCGFKAGEYSARQLRRQLGKKILGHSNPENECPKKQADIVTVKVHF